MQKNPELLAKKKKEELVAKIAQLPEWKQELMRKKHGLDINLWPKNLDA
jgi:hypothetical protein